MSKLDPRPNYKGPLHSWDTLNQQLKSTFNQPGDNFLVIDFRKFSIPKEEIIAEAEKQGYKVSLHEDHYLKFE